MSPIQTRFILRKDLRPEQTWALAEWCISKGATEFTVELMSLVGSTAIFLDNVESSLEPFKLPDAVRERMVTLAGDERVRPTRLWRANADSLSTLRRFFSDGLFDMPNYASDEGWLEDPTFYRDGEVMLGIVSHEAEGMIRLTDLEQVQLAARSVPSRLTPEWI